MIGDWALTGVEPSVSEYINGGAGDGQAVRLNEVMWQRWALVPRVLRDHSAVDTSIELFGQRLRVPILAGPWGNHGLLHPRGEVETASGAAKAGAGFVLSSSSSQLIEDVAPCANAFLVQLYLPPKRESVLRYVDTARRCGARGLMLTADAPASTDRMAFRTGISGIRDLHHPNWQELHAPPSSAPDLGAEDIQWLAERSGLPVVVKGILHPDDADLVIEAGASGIAVSNHGGRQLAGSITAAEILPEVVAAVDGRCQVLVDGGIRSGEDVFRALALGADAVMISRPVAWALAQDGAAAVTRLLDTIREELSLVLACCGARDLSRIEPGMVRLRSI